MAGPCARGDHETCQVVAGLGIGSCGCSCHQPKTVAILGDGERGQAKVTYAELAWAERWQVQEFERVLTEEAIARGLDVTVEDSPTESAYIIRWKPATHQPGVAVIRR